MVTITVGLIAEKGQDILLGLLPFYHIYGLVVILLNGLKRGSQTITLPKFEQQSFIRTYENEKVSFYLSSTDTVTNRWTFFNQK
jgi:4-coumarate--CoA ligase